MEASQWHETALEHGLVAYANICEWLQVQAAHGVPEDLIWSLGAGVVVAIGVLVFGNRNLSDKEKEVRLKALKEEDDRAAGITTTKKPKQPKAKAAAGGEEKDPTLDEMLNPPVDMEMDEEEILRKTEKFRKLFGASDQDVRDAIEKAKDQNRRGLSAAEVEMEEPWIKSTVKAMERVIFFLCIIGGIWSLNIMTRGDVGRMMYGLFPREIELIGLKDYFATYGTPGQYHHHTPPAVAAAAAEEEEFAGLSDL